MGRAKKVLAIFMSILFMFSGVSTGYAAERDSGKSTMNENQQSTDIRETINFNNDWRFKKGAVKGAEAESFDDSKWLYVNLPHAIDHYTPDNKDAYLGVSWYRKSFTLAQSLNGKKLMLHFEAAMQSTEIWINGKMVMTHEGGYTPFNVDISDSIHYDQANTIAVKIDSRANASFAPGKTNPDFQYWGGIYGNSYITVTDKILISDVLEADMEAGGGIFITAPQVSDTSALLKIKTNISNQSNKDSQVTVQNELLDEKGAILYTETSTQWVEAGSNADFNQKITVANPRLWSIYTPELYTVRTTVKEQDTILDSMDTIYGIRKVEWKREGLFINDQHMDVNSTNLHSETYMLGNAMPDSAIDEEVKRVKEDGFDGIRMAHYPHRKAFYDACDKYGLMVLECIAGWQYYNNAQDFRESTYSQMRTMVRTKRNHPSIVAWEPSLNESNYTTAWAKEMNRITKAEYPVDGISRAYTAGCVSWSEWDIGLGTPQADIFGTGGAGANGSSNSQKPVIIAEYGDWNYGGSSSSTRVTREGINTYGIKGGDAGMLIQADNLQESTAVNNRIGKDWLGMSAYWHYSDYAGFDNNMLSNSGVVDVYRIKKHGAYFYRSQRPADIDMSEYEIETGPMVYIANTWAADSPTDVRIFSNCDTVELFLNGKSLGEQGHDTTIWGPHGDNNHKDYPATGQGKEISSDTLKNAPITFKLDKFEAGELRAVGKIKGVQKAENIRNTPGTASSIDLRPENEVPLKLDGSDSRLVWIDIKDSEGTVVNTAYTDVTLSVEGPGIVVGEKTVKTRGGQLAVWVRSKRGTGTITLTATADNLSSKAVILPTAEVSGLPSVPVGGDADESEFVEAVDLYLNKPVSASSENVNDTSNEPAELANDGNMNTFWCEAGINTSPWPSLTLGGIGPGGEVIPPTPQWLQIDLEGVYKLQDLSIALESASKNYRYYISVSDDPDNFDDSKMVVDMREAAGDESGEVQYSLNGAEGRYVRITFTKVTGGKWAAIREVSGTGTISNIALNKPVSASTENIGAGGKVEYAKYANDGDEVTRWCAKGGTGTSGHWWQVDLENIYELSNVHIKFELDNAAYKFVLQGSVDGINYKDIEDFRTGGGCGQDVDIDTSMKVRYLRLYDITTKDMNKQWPCIAEVSATGNETDLVLSSVSREKQAYASSSAEGSEPGFGSNGVPGYFWYPNTLNEEWWYIDVNGFYDIDNVQMTWNEVEIHKYIIETSTDGENWEEAADRSDNTEAIIRSYDEVGQLARFVRVRLPGVRATSQGFGLLDAYAPVAKPKEVKNIIAPQEVHGVVGTSFDNLLLPKEVKATLDKDIKISLPVIWSSEGYDANRSEPQTITGAISQLEGSIVTDTFISVQVLLETSEAQKIADALTAPIILPGDRQLKMPAVPEGFQITLTSSDNEDVIGLDGVVYPLEEETDVELTFTVTKAAPSEGAADTGIREMTVTVPAKLEEPPIAELGLRTLDYTIQLAQEMMELGEVEKSDTETQKKFKEAFDQGTLLLAKATAGSTEVTQSTIEQSASALAEIMCLLHPDITVERLDRVIRGAQNLIPDGGAYIPGTYKRFTLALEQAEAMRNNSESSGEQREAVWKELVSSISDLRIKTNKATLDNLLITAKAVNPVLYKPEGIAVLNTAIKNGEAVSSNEEALEEEVKQAEKALTEAIAALVPAVNEAQRAADAIKAPVINTGDTRLTMPIVPAGFKAALTASSNLSVIALNGTITPQAKDTAVTLTFTVSHVDQNISKDIGKKSVTVTVPAKKTPVPEAKISLSKVAVGKIADQTYTGKQRKPSIQLKYKGKKLTKNKDYTVSYKSNVKIGTGSVILKGKGTYQGTRTAKFQIIPKKPNIVSVKPGKKNTLDIKWKKVSNISGYQISYSLQSKKGFKTVTLKSKATKTTLKKLKSGKKYYVKMRTYKTVNGKRIYSQYTELKKSTTK